jgi:hypothetical protein
MHLQLYGIYLSSSNSELALVHAKEALRRSEELLWHSLTMCKDHLHRHKSLFGYVIATQLKHPQYSLQESPHYKLFHQLVLKTLPVLNYLQGKHTEPPRIDTDWVPGVGLRDMYRMQPLDLAMISKVPEMLEEFQEESLLYKINIHACIAYLITEECRKLKYSAEKWGEVAFRCAKMLPREWFIVNMIMKREGGRERKCKSVRRREGGLEIRKASFSPDRQNVLVTPMTPSGFASSGKNSLEFSKRIKRRQLK